MIEAHKLNQLAIKQITQKVLPDLICIGKRPTYVPPMIGEPDPRGVLLLNDLLFRVGRKFGIKAIEEEMLYSLTHRVKQGADTETLVQTETLSILQWCDSRPVDSTIRILDRHDPRSELLSYDIENATICQAKRVAEAMRRLIEEQRVSDARHILNTYSEEFPVIIFSYFDNLITHYGASKNARGISQVRAEISERVTAIDDEQYRQAITGLLWKASSTEVEFATKAGNFEAAWGVVNRCEDRSIILRLILQIAESYSHDPKLEGNAKHALHTVFEIIFSGTFEHVVQESGSRVPEVISVFDFIMLTNLVAIASDIDRDMYIFCRGVIFHQFEDRYHNDPMAMRSILRMLDYSDEHEAFDSFYSSCLKTTTGLNYKSDLDEVYYPLLATRDFGRALKGALAEKDLIASANMLIFIALKLIDVSGMTHQTWKTLYALEVAEDEIFNRNPSYERRVPALFRAGAKQCLRTNDTDGLLSVLERCDSQSAQTMFILFDMWLFGRDGGI